MKKFKSLGLLLLMVLGTALSASAYSITIKWETPGSVVLKTGGINGTVIDVAADATEYSTGTLSTFKDLYVFPAVGYALTGLTNQAGTDISNKIIDNTSGQYFGGRFAPASIASQWGSGSTDVTLNVSAKKIENTASFTINVKNGASVITTAQFAQLSRSILPLKDGENTIMFDPEVYKDLTLSTGQDMYSVTYNGQTVAPKFTKYTISNIEAGSTIEVSVYEPGQVVEDAELTIEYPEALAGCIQNVRNVTLSKFLSAEDYADGKLTVTPGTKLNFIFNLDFSFTKFTLGTEDITSSFIPSSGATASNSGTIAITVDESTTFAIEGAPTEYADQTWKAYLLTGGMEGLAGADAVKLYRTAYGQNELLLSEATEVNGTNTTLPELIDSEGNLIAPSYEFTTSTSKGFTFPVSEKREITFVETADPSKYYIAIVEAKEIGDTSTPQFTTISAASGNNIPSKEFYVIAKELTEDAKTTFNVEGDLSKLRFNYGSTIAGMWGNQAKRLTLANGTQTLSYNSALTLPFTLGPIDAPSMQIFLDGVAVAADDNGNFPVTPEVNGAVPAQISVFTSGTNKVGAVSLETEGDVTVAVAYSELKHATSLSSSKSFLAGTKLYLTPSTPSCVITINDEVVYGNGVGELVDGAFVYTTTTGKALINVTEVKTFDIAVTPESGATLKALTSVSVMVPMLDEMGEKMPYSYDELIAKVSLTKEGAQPIYATGLGEAGMNDEGTAFVFPILFESPEEAGEYTLTIPQGTFVESQWDDSAESFVPVDGGAVSNALTAVYTIDSNFKSKLDTYTLTPADGAALSSISAISLTFTELKGTDMVEASETMRVFFSNGNVDYIATASRDWNKPEVCAFTFTFMDADYEDATATAAGTWTLEIPEGFFTFDGMSSSAITAQYKVSSDYPVYPISPAPGSTTSKLKNITITFPGVSEIEYNEDVAITLAGDNDFSSSSTYVAHAPTSDFCVVSFPRTPIEEGSYTVTFPAGAFTLDGKPSVEAKATYTYVCEWKLTPAPGSVSEDLTVLTLEFPFATTAEYVGGNFSLMLSNGASFGAYYSCEEVAGAQHPTFKLTCTSDGVIPNGSFSFIAEEGAFILDGEESAEINVTLRIQRSLGTDYTVSPESTMVLDYGYVYPTIIFADGASVRTNGSVNSKMTATLDGEAVSLDGAQVEGNMYLMMFQLTPGKLVIDIEAGAFLIDGTESSAIHAEWDVVEAKEYDFNITPDNTEKVGSIGTFEITFPGAKKVELYNQGSISLYQGYAMVQGLTVNVDILEPAAAQASDEETEETPVARITFTPEPTTAGEYRLSIRRGAFTIDGAFESPAIELYYTLDPTVGVTIIGAETNDNVTVISLDGKVLLQDAPKAKLAELPAGIYVINGKKALIK